MDKKTAIISFREADINVAESTVIYDLNMDVYPGDFLYIVGKVGTGKTSIIRTIIAENPLWKGSGEVCGYNLGTIREKDIPYLRRKLGVVFQDFQLLMDRSVEENLLFVLKATGWKNSGAMAKRIREVLEAVGMEHKSHRMPHQLSGGEQQRVAIARALLNDPEVIIADEPTGNLDSDTADGIMKLLSSINKDRGTAVVMVTHNRGIFEAYPGRVMECRDEGCYEIAPSGAPKTEEAGTESEEIEKGSGTESEEIENGAGTEDMEIPEAKIDEVTETEEVEDVVETDDEQE